MRRREKFILAGVILLLIVGLIYMPLLQKRAPFDPDVAQAVTKYAEVIPGIQTMPIHFSRVVTTTGGLTFATFYMPFKAELLGISAVARLLETTSTDETYTLDIKEGGVSMLSTPIPLYQTTMGTGVITDTSIAADAKVDLVLTIAATTHAAGVSCTDLTTLITIRRTN